MEVKDIKPLGDRIIENMKKVIVGKDEVIALALTSLLAGGHVLLDDVPGTGKTTLAKSLAASLDCDFKRIQFTPDLLPSDVTGQSIFDQRESTFTFRPGPVFCNILLADELNRATPRTQSALLEAMEERQISADGETRLLERPFFVIATQNPVETQGTFPLPEAQLDRFLMRLSVGYPEYEGSVEMIGRFIESSPLETLQAVAAREDIAAAQSVFSKVFVSDDVRDYIVKLTEATRTPADVVLGVSPRGMLGLLRACQAWAALQGREYVLPDDVKKMVPHVFSHRMILRGSYSQKESKIKALLQDLLDRTPVPTEELREDDK